MDACGLHTSALVIFIEHMITGAFRELLTEDVAEEKVVIAFMLSVFEVLGEDIDHCSIERNDQWLSVLRDVNVYHVVVEIKVLDLNVHKASLPDSCAEKKFVITQHWYSVKEHFLTLGFFKSSCSSFSL